MSSLLYKTYRLKFTIRDMEKYVYRGKPFVCGGCSRRAHTKKEGVTQCAKCRGRDMKDYRLCDNCGRRFMTTIGKVLCRNCFGIGGNFSTSYKRSRLIKWYASPLTGWSQQIKLLYVKVRANLISPVDMFQICHIFMECIGDENKYCALEPDQQIQYMILELKNLVIEFEKPQVKNQRKGRAVELIDDDGLVLKAYISVPEAAHANRVTRGYVRQSSRNGGWLGKRRRIRFRYAP